MQKVKKCDFLPTLWATPVSETEMISMYTLFKLCISDSLYEVKLHQNLLEQQLNQF